MRRPRFYLGVDVEDAEEDPRDFIVWDLPGYAGSPPNVTCRRRRRLSRSAPAATGSWRRGCADTR